MSDVLKSQLPAKALSFGGPKGFISIFFRMPGWIDRRESFRVAWTSFLPPVDRKTTSGASSKRRGAGVGDDLLVHARATKIEAWPGPGPGTRVSPKSLKILDGMEWEEVIQETP